MLSWLIPRLLIPNFTWPDQVQRRVICYGEYPDTPHAPVSVLMTRVPGQELGLVYEMLSIEEKMSIGQELRGYLDVMCGWSSPWGGDRVCSIVGISIRSIGVPDHRVGPCEAEDESNETLYSLVGQVILSPSLRIKRRSRLRGT